MGDGRTIVVVGAGIAGLTAALALTAKGFRVVVCERADKLSEIGAGIQLAPNAGRVLADLGLDDAIAAAAIEPKSIDLIQGRTGSTITVLPSSAFRDRYGFPTRVIHRADLQTILARASTRAGVRLEFGTTIGDHMARTDGLLVRTRKGTRAGEVIAGVAVVGADGVWSAVRDEIPGSARPTATGRTAWRALVPADAARDIVALDHVGLWLGPDAHFVHYPVAQGAAVNVVAIVREDWEGQGWNAPGNPEEIARRFADWSSAARAILTAPFSWRKYALLTLDPTSQWTVDRRALIGDAAHAMAPFLAQGAAMAIEDAAVLADRLQGTTDIPAALAAYAAARKPRVARVAAAANRAGEHYHVQGITALVRNTALRFAGPRLALDRNDWIYGWKAAATP